MNVSCLKILAEERVRCTGSDTEYPLPKYKMYRTLYSKVVDPDPYIIWAPVSGSVIQRYGSGSFYHQAKIVKKTLIPSVL
jgi:hypothetical protein